MPVRKPKYLETSRLSKDGKWRSFSTAPNLLQYVPSGQYYARVKIDGKIIRRSLETDIFTAATEKLPDALRKHKSAVTEIGHLLFKQAVEGYKQSVTADSSMKASSKEYRFTCIRKIELSWPELWERRLDTISTMECQKWASKLRNEIAAQYFNNTLDTIRQIFEWGLNPQNSPATSTSPNPAAHLQRARVRGKELKLPEPEQFRQMIKSIRLESGGWGPKAADLVEFLAYSGCRLYTEAGWVTWEDVDWERKQLIIRGDAETGTKNWEIRRIPLLPDMENLLKRMSAEREGKPTGPLLQIARCPESLRRACDTVGIPRLTHHDLRHLFATRCIESGVDIPTVSRWLGHKDGGALAMKTYGHLRNEHSQAMAAKVKF